MNFIKDLGYSHHTPKAKYHNAECTACGKIYKIRYHRLLSNSSYGYMNVVIHGEEHGHKKSPELSVYTKIKNRCVNPNSVDYKNYGGRGIILSKDWMFDFSNFLRDMGRKPTSTSTIERVNVNGNYCKENCIWLEKRLQNRNTRRTRYVTYCGETLIMSDMLKKYDVSKTIFYRKLKLGISEIEIIDQYRRK